MILYTIVSSSFPESAHPRGRREPWNSTAFQSQMGRTIGMCHTRKIALRPNCTLEDIRHDYTPRLHPNHRRHRADRRDAGLHFQHGSSTPPMRTPAPLARGTMRSRRPDEELRVAVIGLRGRGWNHVHAFERLDHVSIVALCDCDSAILDRRAAEFEQTHARHVDAVIDYRTLLDRDDIDVISIATPNHWHALMTVEACNAGKDVYVEKPVSHNVAEGEHILDIRCRHRAHRAGRNTIPILPRNP